MPVDIAGNVMAARGQPGIIGNAFARNQNLANSRTNNALGQQSLRLNESAEARANQANTRANTQAGREGRDYARSQVAQAMTAIANAQDPLTAARNITSNQQFIGFATELGIDPQRFQMGPQVTPDVIKSAAATMAQELGGVTSQLENTALPSDVRSSLYFRGLTPEQQAQEIARRRALQLTETGAGTEVVDPLTRQTGGLVSPNASASAIADRASSEAAQVATAETGARGLQTQLQTQIDEGFAGADSLPVINRGIELLETGIRTGGFSQLSLWAANRLGITGADEGELSANLGKAVLSQLRQTFGAQFTEREGARLNEIEAGFGKSAEVNMRLLQQARAIAERSARRGITAAQRAGRADDARLIEEAMNTSLDYETDAQQPAQQEVPRVTTDADYNAIQSGQQYMAPDGSIRTKR